jgi:hypothetical protein
VLPAFHGGIADRRLPPQEHPEPRDLRAQGAPGRRHAP